MTTCKDTTTIQFTKQKHKKMSHNINGHNNKSERLKRSAHIYARYQAEDTNEVLFFAKGEHRGVLTVKDTTMEWNVYRDAAFSKQLDWNHPDCYPQYAVHRFNGGALQFISMLNENGWKSTTTGNADVPVRTSSSH